MIGIDTVFYIFDRLIITLFYKKKYAVKIRLIRLVCVPRFFLGGGTFVPVRKRLRLCLAPSILTGSTCRDSCNKVEPCRNKSFAFAGDGCDC
jgi:hypothetical protein